MRGIGYVYMCFCGFVHICTCMWVFLWSQRSVLSVFFNFHLVFWNMISHSLSLEVIHPAKLDDQWALGISLSMPELYVHGQLFPEGWWSELGFSGLYDRHLWDFCCCCCMFCFVFDWVISQDPRPRFFQNLSFDLLYSLSSACENRL